MKKIDPVVLHETGYIAIWTVILSVLMESVFLVLGYFDYTVLLGGLLGVLAAVLNFFLMALSVQKAVERDSQANVYTQGEADEDSCEGEKPTAAHKEAAQVMRISQSLRMLMMIAFAAVGAIVPCFNLIAVLIPFFFPRIAIMLRPMFVKKGDSADKGSENN